MKLNLLLILVINVCQAGLAQSFIASNNLATQLKNDGHVSRPLLDNKYKKSWRSIKDAPPTVTDKIYIDFVGKGDIQKSLSEGTDIQANTGLGVIFERFAGYYKILQSFELESTINIATTADTITSVVVNDVIQNQRSFGTYALNPISANQALFINANLYFGYPLKSNNTSSEVVTSVDDKNKFRRFAKLSKVISGINIRVIASNNVWQHNSNSTNLGALAFRAGVFHEFMPDNHRLTEGGRSKYSIYVGANYSYRGIYGDIKSSTRQDFRNQILGSNQTSFNGFEANFGFRLNNLRAEFQMPMLNKKSTSIDGITNTQFIFSIRFVGGFSLKLPTD